MSDPEQEWSEPEPLYVTTTDNLPRDRLTVMHLAAIIHRAAGTLGDVSLHPRGCGSCASAVRVATRIGISVPPLYADELPAERVTYEANGVTHVWNWRTGTWGIESEPIAGHEGGTDV